MNNDKETHLAFYDFELLMNDGEKVIFKENKILILTWRNLTITLKAKKHLQESSQWRQTLIFIGGALSLRLLVVQNLFLF